MKIDESPPPPKEAEEKDGRTGGRGDGESAGSPVAPEVAPEAAALEPSVAPIAQPEDAADGSKTASSPPSDGKPEPPARTRPGLLEEPAEKPVAVFSRVLARQSRRDFVLFGAGAIAAAAGIWWLLPDETRSLHLTPRLRDWLDSL